MRCKNQFSMCVAAAGSLALASSGLAQNFIVGGWDGNGNECGTGASGPPPGPGLPQEAAFSCNVPGPESFTMSGWASAGGVLEFEFEVENGISCGGCFSRPGARAHADTIGILVTADGQSGPVAAELTLGLFALADLSYTCGSYCETFAPFVPSVDEFFATVEGGGDVAYADGSSGGWHSDTWRGTLQIGSETQISVRMECQVDLDITTNGGTDQVSFADVRGLTVLGPVNPDGSVAPPNENGAFGPVFTFPDCPTCKANAPEIGLIDNYIYPPPGTCIGDLDGDNDTDVLDFGEFAASFGSTGLFPGANGDMDYDGDCDVLDFGAWAADFGCGS